MTVAECQVETMKHIEEVRKNIMVIINKIAARGMEHDKLKMESPEVEVFTEYTPKLSETTYGSEEYKTYLKEMQPALKHHYANYRHHPEHFQNGINDMNLIDIVEMLCDWKASASRHNDGNLLTSISINAKRFGIDKQLQQILINTVKMFEEQQ